MEFSLHFSSIELFRSVLICKKSTKEFVSITFYCKLKMIFVWIFKYHVKHIPSNGTCDNPKVLNLQNKPHRVELPYLINYGFVGRFCDMWPSVVNSTNYLLTRLSSKLYFCPRITQAAQEMTIVFCSHCLVSLRVNKYIILSIVNSLVLIHTGKWTEDGLRSSWRQ